MVLLWSWGGGGGGGGSSSVWGASSRERESSIFSNHQHFVFSTGICSSGIARFDEMAGTMGVY